MGTLEATDIIYIFKTIFASQTNNSATNFIIAEGIFSTTYQESIWEDQ